MVRLLDRQVPVMIVLPSLPSLPRFLRSRIRARFLSLLTIAALAGCASGEPPPFRTVSGPESWPILTGLHGRFTLADATLPCYPVRTLDPVPRPHCVSRPLTGMAFDGGLSPEREDTVLRLRVTPHGTTAADAALPWLVALQRLTECGSSGARCRDNVETIATWPRAPGGDPYHLPLALSPDGGTVAVVPASHLLKGRDYSGRLPSDARFHGLRHVGELMLVDLRTHAVRDAGIEVVGDQPITWSADGKRLLIVRAEAEEALPQRLASGIDGPVGHPGQGVPIVETWDVDSGAITMLAIGLQPLWSPDNRTLLFQPAHDRVATLDLDDHVARDVALPGMSTRYEAVAIAFVAPRKVLYWALPTWGADPGFTQRNSPLVGPKQLLSLKVADLDTGAFATVYPALDPRARVGYRAASDSRADGQAAARGAAVAASHAANGGHRPAQGTARTAAVPRATTKADYLNSYPTRA